ncbi:unnamed protein product [Gulo gulo]|uniref:Uncharacterized protein n=1 Tax=Gulo gulo TaxID=48420 RepID=A0A9X9LF39_GULGU|nr:unnamed protein product [Gulo gulo]
MVSRSCEQRFFLEVEDLVCADVDVKACDPVGMEILSPLFGTLHPSFYLVSREDFSYQHWLQSQAHFLRDQGDVYYMGVFSQGLVVEVHRLTLACYQEVVNMANGIEVVWHDKSHVNRYLLNHKPIEVLSTEDDLWDPLLLGCPL